MGVNKVEFNGTSGLETLIDLSNDTVTTDSLLAGAIAHDKHGDTIVGTIAPVTIYRGTTTPTSSMGKNGDLYLHLESSHETILTIDRVANTSGSISGNYYAQCVGVTTEDGSGTNNCYASGSQSSTAYVEYAFDFSSIPSDATIDSLTLTYKGHEENASRSTATVQLYCGSTVKGSVSTINGTSNAVYTVTTGTWTRAELDDLRMRFTMGYYGGLIVGCTLTVEYSSESLINGQFEATTSAFSLTSTGLYLKQSGAWLQVNSVDLGDFIKLD